MKYRVVYTAAFIDDVDRLSSYLRAEGADEYVIESWFNRLFAAADELDILPDRFPVDEWQTLRRGREIRKFVFGRYIISYTVNHAEHRVEIVALMHGARRA